MCHYCTLFADQKIEEYNLVLFLPVESFTSGKEKLKKKTKYQTSKSSSPPYHILNLNVYTSLRLFIGETFF